MNELDLEHPEENKIYEELSPLLGKIHKQNRQIQKQLELAKAAAGRILSYYRKYAGRSDRD